MRGIWRACARGSRAIALASAGAVLAGTLGVFASVSSGATLTEYPSCIAPPGGDTAACTSGRSPGDIVPGPDGGMWFTLVSGEIGRVSTGGALTLTPLPAAPGLPRDPDGITLGPDGALWFNENFGNRIGRVTTAGSFTFFGDPDTRPNDITLGPDGALWLTEARTPSIGRITVSGALTHFPVPPLAIGGVRLFDIAPGPHGRVWFTEIGADRIGAITTGGVVTEYKLPPKSLPEGITRGPDGAMWFAEWGTGRVGRITTGGKITHFTLPAKHPSAIALGPDGALWVGLNPGSSILRLTTSGSVNEIPLLSGAAVNGIAAGPDGCIWFTVTDAARVGRLCMGLSGKGPTVTSISPSGGSTSGGDRVTILGRNLRGASRVGFGDTPDTPATVFRVESDARITATTPPHATGPVPVHVTVRGERSHPSEAARFTYVRDPIQIAAPPPTAQPPIVAELGKATESGAVLRVPVEVAGPASFELVAALASGSRQAGTRSSARRIGRVAGRFAKAGRRVLRLRLPRPARRSLARSRRRGLPIHVAVSLRGDADPRKSVEQRSYRVR